MNPSPFRLTIERLFEKQFLKLISKQKDIARACMTAAAFSYSQYVRRYWVSGQAVPIRTGRTAESVKFGRPKKAPKDAPIYQVRPGFGIPGNLNYLAGVERGTFSWGHPFMKPSFEVYKPNMVKIAIETYRTKTRKELGR